MHARSALFDLYGDHLAGRGGWAPISAVVRLLAAVDVAPAATRTAVSRMAREGWLAPDERAGARGYAATDRARTRLAAAWRRIYAVTTPPWDGRWHVVVTDHVGDRSRRARLADSLGYLGYGRLSTDTWVAPRASDELDGALGGVRAQQFFASFLGDGPDLAARVWDVTGLAGSYREFLSWADAVVSDTCEDVPEQAYASRARIVHEWRKFLFTDPGLPPEVLPAEWPGSVAARSFVDVTSRLRPAAVAYVDACLEEAGAHMPA